MTRPSNDQLNRLALLLQTAAIATTEANLATISLVLNLLAIATTATTTIPRHNTNQDEPEQPHDDNPDT